MKVFAKEEKKYKILESFLETEDALLRPITQAFVQLLTSGIQNWGKKNTTLLAMQCGSSIFINTLVQSAFRLSVVEPFDSVRSKLRSAHPKINIYGTSLTYINADTNSFDYAILVYPLLCQKNIDETIRETLRVTRRSILILGVNILSLEYIFSRWNSGLGSYMQWTNPYILRNKIYAIQENCAITTSSIGIFPLLYRKKCSIISRFSIPVPIGGVFSLRIDIPPFIAYTPLLQPVKTRKRSNLEWSNVIRDGL